MSPALYTFSPADLASVTLDEVIYGTERLLPAWDAIPADFKNKSNPLNAFVRALAFGTDAPDGNVVYKAGYSTEDVEVQVLHLIRAHVICENPTIEHRIAGIAFMLSWIFYR